MSMDYKCEECGRDASICRFYRPNGGCLMRPVTDRERFHELYEDFGFVASSKIISPTGVAKADRVDESGQRQF